VALCSQVAFPPLVVLHRQAATLRPGVFHQVGQRPAAPEPKTPQPAVLLPVV
jgi:hypothetical protein